MKQMNLKKLMKVADSKSTKYKKVKDGRNRVGIHSSLKENYDNRIIFVREGMYVYAYGEDAKIVSEVVGIPIENGEVAIHYEDVTECLKKLINAGYKAGIENDWSFHDADLEEYYKQKKSVSDSRKIQDYSYRSAAKYNKRNDEIFASYEKYLRKEMEWLRRQGVSEDEIQNAYRHTGLGGSGLAKLIQQVAVENGDNRELSEILGEAHSIADSRRVSDSGYEENGRLGLEIRQWTQSESPSYTDVVDRLKSYGYSYVFKISKGKKVYEFWKLNNSDYGVTIVCVGDSVINAIREDYDSFLQGA